MEDTSTPQPGGFILPSGGGLPSPTPSSASSRPASGLPHPRAHPLRPYSRKEDTVRRYVDERLLYVSRRYVKKFSGKQDDNVAGYKTFGEVCRDLDGIVNVLWLSGTPALQVPFLLKLASDFTQYVRSFPPSPKASFELLGKLDHCFSSLLSGQDSVSKEPLPGFENGLRAGMTVTDMVRCRSLVEQTRFLMVEVLSGGDVDEEDEDESKDGDDDTEAESEPETIGGSGARWDIDEERLHLDAARIYENTIVELNHRLGDRLADQTLSDTTMSAATALPEV